MADVGIMKSHMHKPPRTFLGIQVLATIPYLASVPYVTSRPIKGLAERYAQRPSSLPCRLAELEPEAQREEVMWTTQQGQCPVVEMQSWGQNLLCRAWRSGTLLSSAPLFLQPPGSRPLLQSQF